MNDALSLADPHTVADPVLASAARRADAVRRVPARLQAARGAARALLRPGPESMTRSCSTTYGRSSGLLRRSDGEEAAQPLPARVAGALLRHRGLQPRVPVLPELGHLQVARDRHARRRGLAGGPRHGRRARSAAAASRSRTTTRRSSWSTRSTSPTRAANGASRRSRSRRLHERRSRGAEFYAHMDAANIDLKAFTDDFYEKVTFGDSCGAVLETLEYLRARDRRLVRDHHAAHPRPQRLRC